MGKKQPKLTPWFPSDVKPVRTGVYETRFSGDLDAGYSMWFGDGWSSEFSDPDVAATLRHYGRQHKDWRGLAADPVAKTIRGIA